MNELEEMCRAHFNEPVIIGFEIARCIGYAEDEMDCYIICRKRDGETMWQTCVGGYTWLHALKGQEYVKSHSEEDWDDFYRLDSLLTFHGCPQEKEFVRAVEDYDD